jgi:hypothetical protein
MRMALWTARFVAHQLRCQLRPLDLFHVDSGFLAGELGQLVAQLVHLGPALPDHHTRAPGMHGDGDLAGPAIEVDLRDRGVPEPGLQVLADQLVFLEQRGHVLAGEPA